MYQVAAEGDGDEEGPTAHVALEDLRGGSRDLVVREIYVYIGSFPFLSSSLIFFVVVLGKDTLEALPILHLCIRGSWKAR